MTIERIQKDNDGVPHLSGGLAHLLSVLVPQLQNGKPGYKEGYDVLQLGKDSRFVTVVIGYLLFFFATKRRYSMVEIQVGGTHFATQ